ncbi:OmpA family protein [uncultured Thiodictyon sp.]|uniref:OmpA family protein n=1 Tax=uncultured Thiodictyon sp. TaxID=1846217 RepID=UPI0025D5AC05|nr:OmpA family protein [uncultured Thiodictyon sp.]
MRKDHKTFRAAAVAASLAMAAVLAAPVSAEDSIGLYWKSAPTTTAWVNPYGECWQGQDGEKLAPCGEVAFVPHAPLVMRLLFEINRYKLQDIRNPEELRKLDTLIAEFKATPREEVVSIVGHTDKLGSLQLNQVLSENRAETIKNYMIDHGYPAADIREVKGMAWEGGNDVAANGAVIDLGPLENNPLRRRVVVTELGPDQLKQFSQ